MKKDCNCPDSCCGVCEEKQPKSTYTKSNLRLEFKAITGDYPENSDEYVEWLENQVIEIKNR